MYVILTGKGLVYVHEYKPRVLDDSLQFTTFVINNEIHQINFLKLFPHWRDVWCVAQKVKVTQGGNGKKVFTPQLCFDYHSDFK